MIIKSSQRAGHRELAAHLIKARDEDGSPQTVAITGYRNVMSVRSVKAALIDMEMMSWASPRTKKDLYHISMNPSEELSAEQWERAWETYEEEFGLSEHPYIEVTHDKKGRVHKHRVYERVDTETEKAIKLSFTKIRNELVARQLEYAFNHQLTVGKHNRTVMLKLAEQGKEDIVTWMEQGKAHANPRPVAKDEFSELQQERRTNIKKADVKAVLQEAWATTDNGAGFETAIAEHNLLLCRGDRRDFTVVDAQGGTHSPRRMLGVKSAQLRERWSDLDPQALLAVSESAALRAAQWQRVQEERAASEAVSLRREMTAAERLLEQQLIDDITTLQTQLYGAGEDEFLGALVYAGTAPLAAGTDDTEATKVAAALLNDDSQLEDANDGTGYGYHELWAWKEQHQDQQPGEVTLPSPALIPADGRSLITQQTHWQTVADAEPERRSPQEAGAAGGGIGKTGSTERPPDPLKQHADTTAGIPSWGLSPNVKLLLQTYIDEQAIAEQQQRIEVALAAAGDSAAAASANPSTGNVRSQPDNHRTGEQSARQQRAGKAYLQDLGRHLLEKGRGAYGQADLWLTQKLAKRGYTKQEARRVLARYSPALMAENPGKRLGYIRRITERVYRRKEYWQQKLVSKLKRNEQSKERPQRSQNTAKAESHLLASNSPKKPPERPLPKSDKSRQRRQQHREEQEIHQDH